VYLHSKEGRPSEPEPSASRLGWVDAATLSAEIPRQKERDEQKRNAERNRTLGTTRYYRKGNDYPCYDDDYKHGPVIIAEDDWESEEDKGPPSKRARPGPSRAMVNDQLPSPPRPPGGAYRLIRNTVQDSGPPAVRYPHQIPVSRGPGRHEMTKPATPSYSRRDTFDQIYARDRLDRITSKGGPGFAKQRIKLELGIFGDETLDKNVLAPRKLTPFVLPVESAMRATVNFYRTLYEDAIATNDNAVKHMLLYDHPWLALEPDIKKGYPGYVYNQLFPWKMYDGPQMGHRVCWRNHAPWVVHTDQPHQESSNADPDEMCEGCLASIRANEQPPPPPPPPGRK